MQPRDLNAEHFKSYPPEARRLAIESLEILRPLPLSFLPSLLREVADYDFKFPIERKTLEKELAVLGSLPAAQRESWFREFAQIQISSQLERSDWAGAPAQFVEQLSAYLWTTHQLDAFRSAATAYADRLQKAAPPAAPQVPRVGITIIGEGVGSYDGALFRRLRAHGAYFSRIKAENGLKLLLDAVTQRAKAHPSPYAHWYIDGGQELDHDASSLTAVSYNSLQSVRAALLRKMQAEIDRPGMGPEALRTTLAQLAPRDLGFDARGDAVLERFQLKLLTEGSGTQIFSTTFVQWTAREALRRAQPLTLLVRFAPRQRQKPMNELLAPGQSQAEAEVDPTGSLVDADMGAYYNWLNQQRLAGAEQSSFLAWFEGHNQALAIGPGVPRGTESDRESDVRELLSWVI
jgi:hypothetical protein